MSMRAGQVGESPCQPISTGEYLPTNLTGQVQASAKPATSGAILPKIAPSPVGLASSPKRRSAFVAHPQRMYRFDEVMTVPAGAV